MSPIIPDGAFASRCRLANLTKTSAFRGYLQEFPRRLPRSQLRPTPILRRASLNRSHQRRLFSFDHASTQAVPDRVVALPLSHRPLLPGMTIQLQIHRSLYNKIATDIHLNKSTMVGAFLAQTCAMDEPTSSQRNRLGPEDPRFVMVNGTLRRVPNRLPMPDRIDRSLIASQFVDLPRITDIYQIGTLCKIVEISAEDGLLIESLRAISVSSVADRSLLTVNIEPRHDIAPLNKDANVVAKLKKEIITLAQQMAAGRHVYANHLRLVVERARAAPDRTDLGMLVNQVAGLCTNMSPDQEQRLVEEPDPIRRAVLFLNTVSPQCVVDKRDGN